MKKHKEEKALTKIQLGVFGKIRSFFNNLFRKTSPMKSIEETIDIKENNIFKETVQIKQDKEKTRILKLQHEFKNGNIDENDIEENDYHKLIKLYDEQNEKLRQEIERYKIETAKMLKKMNNE